MRMIVALLLCAAWGCSSREQSLERQLRALGRDYVAQCQELNQVKAELAEVKQALAEQAVPRDAAPDWDPRSNFNTPPPPPKVTWETDRVGLRDNVPIFAVWRVENGKRTRMIGYARHTHHRDVLIERDRVAPDPPPDPTRWRRNLQD